MRPAIKRAIAWGLMTVVSAILISVGGFLWWAMTPLGPSSDALEALESDRVWAEATETPAGWVFVPSSEEASIGLVLYPGGRVDARSYAPLARAVSERGYLVVLQPMPLNLAVLGVDRAAEAMAAHPEVRAWAVGGHSLGGAMAAQYAAGDESVGALVLLAAYAPEGADLSARQIGALSVRGTLDTVLDGAAYEAGKALLPADTVYADLRGGNHAQFGSYGPQPGDTEATMPAEGQITATVDAIDALLSRLR